MSKIKNKTLIKVGDNVYHPLLGTYQVVEMSPLTNRICYVVLGKGDCRLECVCINSKATGRLTTIDFYMDTPFYISSMEAKRQQARLDRERRHSEIGYAVEQIFSRLPWTSKGGII